MLELLLTAYGEDPNADPQALADLVEALEGFCGTLTVTLSEFRQLAPIERRALRIAAQRVELRRAAMLATAQSGPLGVANLMAELDGGQALAEAACAVGTALAREAVGGDDAGP